MRILGWISVVVLVCSCADNRPTYLDWPASLTRIDGVEQSNREVILEILDGFNDEVGFDLVSTNSQHRSKIQIQVVTEFKPLRFSRESNISVFLEYRGIGGSTQTAGRATLEIDFCRIELAKFLVENPDRQLLEPVLVHEIGHCTGLKHEDSAGELMSPITFSLPEYDVDEFSRFFDSVRGAVGI